MDNKIVGKAFIDAEYIGINKNGMFVALLV